MCPGRSWPTRVGTETHGHAPRRTADTHAAIQATPRRPPRRGYGYGRENMCTGQSWPARVATKTHRHTPQRTASEIVSLQRRYPSAPAGGAPATGGKTRAPDNHGLHLYCLGRAAVVILRCFRLRWVRCQAWITPPKPAAPPSTTPSPSSGAIPRYPFQVGGWHLKNVAVPPP